MASATKETDELDTAQPRKESLYRTLWLMSYNALHDIAVGKQDAVERMQEYREEAKTAEHVASRPG